MKEPQPHKWAVVKKDLMMRCWIVMSPLQVGRGQDDERPFNIESVTLVNIKKFENDCHRLFKSQQCYEQHKQSRGNARSVCQSLLKCTKCKQAVRHCKQVPKKRQCGLKKCWVCGKFVRAEGHRCFIQPETKKRKTSSVEEEEEVAETGTTYQLSSIPNVDKGKRKPKMSRLKNRCKNYCSLISRVDKKTGTTNRICVLFTMRLVMNGFSKATILGTSSANGCSPPNMPTVRSWPTISKGMIVISFSSIYVKYAVIMRGAKVFSLTVEMFNIRFVDSLNFIPVKLANFPKTFGIEELTKGYFPHLFNKKEIESFVGPILPALYYNSNGMNPKDRETFMAWHTMKKESNYVFNFQE